MKASNYAMMGTPEARHSKTIIPLNVNKCQQQVNKKIIKCNVVVEMTISGGGGQKSIIYEFLGIECHTQASRKTSSIRSGQ